MKEEISNKTILILVVLTVVISTLGTLTVLDSVNNINSAPIPVGHTQVSSGEVTLSLKSPPPTGYVSLKIVSLGDS
jgi:hypothetical protein